MFKNRELYFLNISKINTIGFRYTSLPKSQICQINKDNNVASTKWRIS